ncbi:hypothetical protein FRC03_011485 [Tulasnella sp. 419]|nr:hypothetical protein FRC03_011485 [Tulasnella sp. 419]
MSESQQTQFGQPYSERNPVATIKKHQEKKGDDNVQVDRGEGSADPTKSGKQQKEEIMQRSQGRQQKPTDAVEQERKKGDRIVKDPTTGQMVLIKDAKFEDYRGGNLDHLDPNDTRGGPATQKPGGGAPETEFKDASKPAPNPAMPGNVLLYNFPAPTDASIKPVMAMLDRLQIGIAASCFIVWIFTAFGSGWWRFFFRSTLIGAVGFGLTTMASIAQRNVEKEVERVRMDMHRQRGETFSPPTPESVEWLNAFIKTLWGLVNPEMFVPIADTIEDVMQQSLPGVVDAVRISDLGQGINPLRIVSMRALPDAPGDKEYPREEWIDQNDPKEREALEKKKTEEGAGKDLDQSGHYVNYELAVSYQALPGQGSQLRSKNIHLLLEFFLGAFDWLHIPIPIWIQIDGIAATVRLRIQFIPNPPFVRNLTFCLMGVPAVEVSAIPLSSKLPNILDLPLISRFVKMAIAAGTAMLIAPKSMTLNIQEMMNAAAIGDTQALGVFIIIIHHAEGLSAQDRNGRSDPYIVLAYAKFGKPLYSTRIILGDLNPVFEETAMMLITRNEVQAEEDLAAMLWDSDKRSADDLIGRVQIPVKELMKEPNVMKRRTDNLTGYENADVMSGKLHWSIGYFEKTPLKRELERPPENPPTAPTKTAPEMEMRPGDKGPNPAKRDLPPPPPDVQRTAPDPEYPSGILSVVIHQINNLERQNLKGTTGKDREGTAGQDTDEASEEGGNLPSSYVEILVNDDMVYKTRVKQYSAMPFFEAGTEVFVRNWETAVVRLVVRDARLREGDPILGIVHLPLKHILAESSEVTRLYSLQEGVGFGRVNVSMCFRSVQAKLPREQLGWDTATVELFNPIRVEIDPSKRSIAGPLASKTTSITVSTTDSTEKVPKNAGVIDENGILRWDVGDMIRLPVYNRYASCVFFEFGSAGVGPIGNKPIALAVVWLKDLVDDEEKEVSIPVVVSKDIRQLRQNALTEFTKKTHDFEVIGYLKTVIKLDSGLDMDHENYAKSKARRHAFETYDHIEGEAQVAEKNAHAMDDGVVDKKERKAIEAAHERQLQNRQRGIAGFKPYRTMKWMKQGIKNRIHPDKPAKREPTVNTEA